VSWLNGRLKNRFGGNAFFYLRLFNDSLPLFPSFNFIYNQKVFTTVLYYQNSFLWLWHFRIFDQDVQTLFLDKTEKIF